MNEGTVRLLFWVKVRGPVGHSLEVAWVHEQPVGRSLDTNINGHWDVMAWVQQYRSVVVLGCRKTIETQKLEIGSRG